MATQNDSSIDRLAIVICRCVKHEVPEDAIGAEINGIVKAAEAKAATILHEDTGNGAGPAKARYDQIRSTAWIINRMLDEFPVQLLHDPSYELDPGTMEDLCRASAAMSAAGRLISKVSIRESDRGAEAQ